MPVRRLSLTMLKAHELRVQSLCPRANKPNQDTFLSLSHFK